MSGKWPFWGLFQTTNKNTDKKNKTTKNKNRNRRHLSACWQTTPYFWYLFQLTLFYFCKLCFAENTKKTVFSAEHSFSVSEIVSPLSRETPVFVVFGAFVWLQRKCHFPKTDSCNENAHFYLPNTHSVCLFSKKAIKDMFVRNHPKHYFLAFFEICLFHLFHPFSFSFFQHKRDKNRKCIFYRKPPLTPW